MSGLLSVATGAMTANQAILQTTGNNIANVNTPGYSRQTAVLQTVQGQFTGGGYIGKGVALTTIQRNYDAFLTTQSALASATSAGDTARSDKLTQLEGIFPGGTDGLGAAVSNLLNSFSDVASAPTDLTARTVTLTQVDETASRLRAASQSLDDLQSSTSQEISQNVAAINTLATNIASVNDQIARAQGSGQPPNDLLDQRDQLVRDLNQYVQTSSIAASDGTVGIFIGGSQALVLGTTAAKLSVTSDDFNDPSKTKLALTRSGQSVTLDENTMGGGSVSGLLRFQNTDLTEGRNLLGRLTLAVTTSMNAQQKLGLDLNGNVGGNLFSPTDISNNVSGAVTNTGSGSLTLGISDITKFAASDYEVDFTGSGASTTGTIKRLSDGVITNFSSLPTTIDGLTISGSGSANGGDRFLLKPFSTAAGNLSSQFSTPSALAVSSPISVAAATSNNGSLAVASLKAQTVASTSAAPMDSYSIKFNVVAGVTTYDIVDTTVPPTDPNTPPTGQPYVAGTPITYTPPGLPGFSLSLTGAASDGDTLNIQQNAYANLNGGNATAMMNLRDTPMFDGSALTDGYAGLIAQIGVRSQSATYSANVSSSIAANLETQRTAVSGVNLDEEASKLIQYQQAYQASAKVIQIAQSLFTTLIQTMG
ncbi:flagellar hook-associated protein FlgK [Rhodoferax sp.]|uniref:flagellar hook-associated protein FlgK n=1 Tax=Rhodoferax sp. TaxID=50421 RepID=UPI002841A3B0|nr:flagellar hook-associated protein FlgK [Rhodoferax sp.]MDR3371362.1 flagellar hook-associated protein FlgK [Rhodoferax sp.]